MPIDTNALSDGVLSDTAFLEHCGHITDEQEKLLFYELNRFRSGFLFCMFDVADAIQHMFWSELDPQHPLHKTPGPDTPAILKAYQRMDDMLGQALNHIDHHTTLIVCSDHGFTSFRKTVHLNRWLIEKGFLSLQDSLSPAAPMELFEGVDWSRSRAYALGLGGGIYLNMRDREKYGAVSETDRASVIAELQKQLMALKDPETGEPVVKRIYLRENIFDGPYLPESPDLFVTFRKGYRISWQSAIGGAPKSPIIEPHLSKWSGDHVGADPDDIPGIFLSNKTDLSVTSVRDLGATFLRLLDTPIPDTMRTTEQNK
jgi:predicted AlkP superfamily phosphohydrolase/phosphomutase